MHVDPDDLLDLVARFAEALKDPDAHRRAVLASRLRSVAINMRHGGALRGSEIMERLTDALGDEMQPGPPQKRITI